MENGVNRGCIYYAFFLMVLICLFAGCGSQELRPSTQTAEDFGKEFISILNSGDTTAYMQAYEPDVAFYQSLYDVESEQFKRQLGKKYPSLDSMVAENRSGDIKEFGIYIDRYRALLRKHVESQFKFTSIALGKEKSVPKGDLFKLSDAIFYDDTWIKVGTKTDPDLERIKIDKMIFLRGHWYIMDLI